MAIPPKLALNRNGDGTDNSPPPQTLWVVPWFLASEEVALPVCYSAHRTGHDADRFARDYSPEGHQRLDYSASYVGHIRFLDRRGNKDATGSSLLVREHYDDYELDLTGVAVIKTTAPLLFTRLEFEEPKRTGGLIITKRFKDPLRVTTCNIEYALTEHGFLPGTGRPKVVRLGTRVATPEAAIKLGPA